MFMKYIFHKIQKCTPQMGFNDKTSLVLTKMKNLTNWIKCVPIEPAWKPKFKTIYRIEKYWKLGKSCSKIDFFFE